MKLFKKETLFFIVQLILIASEAKRRRGKWKKNKHIKSILPINSNNFWLEPAVKGVLIDTGARGAIIFYDAASKVERPLANYITTEFSKQVSSIKIECNIRNMSRFEGVNHPLVENPQSTLHVLLCNRERDLNSSLKKLNDMILFATQNRASKPIRPKT